MRYCDLKIWPVLLPYTYVFVCVCVLQAVASTSSYTCTTIEKYTYQALHLVNTRTALFTKLSRKTLSQSLLSICLILCINIQTDASIIKSLHSMNRNNQHTLKTTKFIFTRTISQQNHMTTIKSVTCLIVWSRDMYSIQWLTSVSMKQWPRSAQLNLYHLKTIYKKYIFFYKTSC